MLMCLVRGRNFGDRAISRAPSLSSNALHLIVEPEDTKLKLLVTISCRKSIIGIASRNAVDSDMYSLSVELCAPSVCNHDAQVIGMPAYLIT